MSDQNTEHSLGNEIAAAAVTGHALAILHPPFNRTIQAAVTHRIAMDHEKAQAEASGLSVEEYRLVQTFPFLEPPNFDFTSLEERING